MEKKFRVFGNNLLLIVFVTIITCVPLRAHASEMTAAQAGNQYAKSELNQEEQKELLKIARNAVETYIRTGKTPASKPAAPALNEKLGVFVTLEEQGQLRGCIGRFEPNIPLYQVVTEMAVAAATQDPRFSPVTVAELSKLDYEISVLSPLRKVGSADEIVVGTHGVQVQKGFRGGVFLPQVATENNWNKETFLSVLCMQKAGLPPDCWKDPGTRLSVFTAQVFGEKE
jgi:AmmeMemoRadiSam system protein A